MPSTVRHLLVLIGFYLLLSPSKASHDEHRHHRVFPAARTERYTQNSSILLTVDPNQFDIAYNATSKDVDDFLNAAKERFLKSLFSSLPDFREDYPKNPNNSTLVPLTRVVLYVQTNSTDLQHGVDESYSLSIGDANDYVALNATTVFGILRGLETFSQLLQFAWTQTQDDEDDDRGVFGISSTPLWIEDAPEYSYRGLMIDTARHYLPVSLIMANLDAMAMNKLNVLHWHMTDTQSFPYQSLQYPELANMGAFHPRRIYTIQDVQLVVEEAKLRGIRVVPEFDMPGHTLAIGKSHPELLSPCPDPSEPIDPTNPIVYEFVDNLYHELAHLFPDAFVHVGGDEVSLDCWKNSSSIQAWMKEQNMLNETDLYNYFETRLLNLVADKNKRAIVWQEAFNMNLTLRNDTIIDVWKGYDVKTIQNATLQSFDVLISGCWYLDHLQDDWESLYQCHPRNFTGTRAQKARVIGGHASMWAERVDASNFMERVWPRASVAAERLWSSGSIKSAETSFPERLVQFRCHMVSKGISASPTMAGCCDREPSYVHEKKRKRDFLKVENATAPS